MNEAEHDTNPHDDLAVNRRTVHLALRPRWTWPWPDLETKIALAERWAKAGEDLRGPLLRLTWRATQQKNLGFVSALASRGVAVHPDVVDAARNALGRLLDKTSADHVWLRYALWFTELDLARAITALQVIAEESATPVDDRFRAWKFLYETSPEDSLEAARILASDSEVHSTARLRIGQALAEYDVATAVAVFEKVATQARDGGVRNEATEFVGSHDPEKAVDLRVMIATDPKVDDAERLVAARRVLISRRAKGVDLLFALLTTVSGDAVRGQVMDDLRRESPERLETRLDQLRRTGAVRVRLDTTRYLVEHFGRGPDIVAELAQDPALSPKDQLRALDIDRRAVTQEIVMKIMDRIGDDTPTKVKAAILLAGLSPEVGFGRLRDIVTDREKSAHHTRMDVVAQASRLLDRPRTADLYAVIALEEGATRGQREAAATAATKFDATKGDEVWTGLAKRPDLPVDDRLRFTRKTEKPLDLLRGFARDFNDPAMQLKAAQHAANEGTSADKRHLLQLMTIPTFAYSSREPIIRKLNSTDRRTVLTKIADNEDGETALEAMIALGPLDKEGARTRLEKLADSRGESPSIRRRAGEAARRLR